MPSHAAFLAAIIARPDDDGPRLVAADWLEEHGGEPARAEFIRVQVKLAAIQRATPTIRPPESNEWLPRAARLALELSRRERELLESSLGLWFAWKGCPVFAHVTADSPAVRYEKVGVAVYRRGFVSEISLSWRAWAGGECEGCRGSGIRYGPGPRGYGFHHDGNGCAACRGTGRVPGHADAILAATPLRKVKLTTWPLLLESADDLNEETRQIRIAGKWVDADLPGMEERFTGRGLSLSEMLAIANRNLARRLAARWPGIEFELPAQQPDGMFTMSGTGSSWFHAAITASRLDPVPLDPRFLIRGPI